jgi:hypothetical protein
MSAVKANLEIGFISSPGGEVDEPSQHRKLLAIEVRTTREMVRQ